MKESPPVTHEYKDLRLSSAFLTGVITKKDVVVYDHGGWHQTLCRGFAVESHFSKTPPILKTFKGVRVAFWQVDIDFETPTGWFPMHTSLIDSNTGVSDLAENNEYWRHWDESARRSRKKWLEQDTYIIAPISREEFMESHKKNKQYSPFLRKIFFKEIESFLESNPKNTHLWGVLHKETKEITAGLCVVDIPDVQQSRHLVAFFHPETTPPHANVGLIDYWFVHCKKNGIRFANFGNMWRKGNPKSWQGFTTFKEKFNPALHTYKKIFWKITLR